MPFANANAGSSAIAPSWTSSRRAKKLVRPNKKKSFDSQAFCFLLLKKSMKVAFYFHFGFKYIYLSIYLFIIPSC